MCVCVCDCSAREENEVVIDQLLLCVYKTRISFIFHFVQGGLPDASLEPLVNLVVPIEHK